jgi:hypothetical protein
MNLSFSVGDIWGGLALIVSMYAAHKTIKFNERQKSLIESQERLNALLLKKEENESLSSQKADLGVSFLKLGNNRYRLKIWNKGKATARNVTITFPDGNDIVPSSELRDKFPLEFLETYGSVELIASVHMQTKSKHTVCLSWSDSFSEHNDKTFYPMI